MAFRRFIARIFWTFSRWKLVSEPAPDRPTVLIGAPHTSNWDFVFMLGIAWKLNMHFRWLGKKSLFTGWRGPIMRGLGGIPVDRESPAAVVGEVLERIRAGEIFGLVVTPTARAKATRTGSRASTASRARRACPSPSATSTAPR